MRPLKLTILVLLFLSFLMSAFFVWLGVSLLRLPRSRILSELMKSFTGVIRILLNVKVTVEGAGDCLGTGGHFIVSNHLGYLDGVDETTGKAMARDWSVVDTFRSNLC